MQLQKENHLLLFQKYEENYSAHFLILFFYSLVRSARWDLQSYGQRVAGPWQVKNDAIYLTIA